jgi:hypothetical protein
MTTSGDRSPTDAEIAAEIQRRGLEIEYLRELSAALGFAATEPWTEEVFTAIDGATPDERRRAALRTLQLTPWEGEGDVGT